MSETSSFQTHLLRRIPFKLDDPGVGLNEYKLVVEVRGLEQLDRTMGATVVDAALADLSPLVNELTARVLRLADRYDAVAASRRGCWSFSFALGAKGSAMQAEVSARIDSIGAAARELAIGQFEHFIRVEGQRLIGWRDVPIDTTGLGEAVLAEMPVIRQAIVARGATTPLGAGSA